jgi:hypothetical protein
MSNVSTIGGAALWVVVVFVLMVTALTPVSVTISNNQRASETAQLETSAPAPA